MLFLQQYAIWIWYLYTPSIVQTHKSDNKTHIPKNVKNNFVYFKFAENL
jgi:hypothetical protein